MRRLALHASALSDEEYDLYTSSLRDIALADEDEDSRSTTKVNGGNGDDDAYFERITIGVREARAWLRGRYSHMSASVIDSVRAPLSFMLSCLTISSLLTLDT